MFSFLQQYKLEMSICSAAVVSAAGVVRNANQKLKWQTDIQEGTAVPHPLALQNTDAYVQYLNYRLCAPGQSAYSAVETIRSFNQLPTNSEYGGSGGCGITAKKLPIVISSLPIELSSRNKDMIYQASAHLSKPCYLLTHTAMDNLLKVNGRNTRISDTVVLLETYQSLLQKDIANASVDGENGGTFDLLRWLQFCSAATTTGKNMRTIHAVPVVMDDTLQVNPLDELVSLKWQFTSISPPESKENVQKNDDVNENVTVHKSRDSSSTTDSSTAVHKTLSVHVNVRAALLSAVHLAVYTAISGPPIPEGGRRGGDQEKGIIAEDTTTTSSNKEVPAKESTDKNVEVKTISKFTPSFRNNLKANCDAASCDSSPDHSTPRRSHHIVASDPDISHYLQTHHQAPSVLSLYDYNRGKDELLTSVSYIALQEARHEREQAGVFLEDECSLQVDPRYEVGSKYFIEQTSGRVRTDNAFNKTHSGSRSGGVSGKSANNSNSTSTGKVKDVSMTAKGKSFDDPDTAVDWDSIRQQFDVIKLADEAVSRLGQGILYLVKEGSTDSIWAINHAATHAHNDILVPVGHAIGELLFRNATALVKFAESNCHDMYATVMWLVEPRRASISDSKQSIEDSSDNNSGDEVASSMIESLDWISHEIGQVLNLQWIDWDGLSTAMTASNETKEQQYQKASKIMTAGVVEALVPAKSLPLPEAVPMIALEPVPEVLPEPVPEAVLLNVPTVPLAVVTTDSATMKSPEPKSAPTRSTARRPTRIILDVSGDESGSAGGSDLRTNCKADSSSAFSSELVAAYSDPKKYNIVTSLCPLQEEEEEENESAIEQQSSSWFISLFNSFAPGPLVPGVETADEEREEVAPVIVVVRRDFDSATHEVFQKYLAEIETYTSAKANYSASSTENKKFPAKVHFVVVCNSPVTGSVFQKYDTNRPISCPTKRTKSPIERKLKLLKSISAAHESSSSNDLSPVINSPSEVNTATPMTTITTSFVSVSDTQEQLFRFVRQSVVEKLTDAVDNGDIGAKGTAATVNGIVTNISQSMNEDLKRMKELI